MIVHRALGSFALALAFAAPPAVVAQTAPVSPAASLAAQTNRYFTAVAQADVVVLSATTSPTFHVITAEGKRLSYEDFLRQITTAALTAIPPKGNSQRITASTITPTGATETVSAEYWFWGAQNQDPMSAPKTEQDFSTHQLTWTRSADGTWQLDEDHITSLMRI